jgi:hypothetical protein
MSATKTKTKPKNKSIFSVHPSIAYAQSVVANMKTRTGRSLEEWIDLTKKSGPKDEAAQRDWLKSEHKLGTNYAWWIAGRVHGKGEDDTDPDAYLRSAEKYVQDMFAGKREALRPIYEKLVEIGMDLGDDVKVCPCQTMVPLYRENVFAQIKPATNTRIDLGLCLREAKSLPKRIVPTGGLEKGDRITHRIPITSVDEIDAEVKRWMKVAYDEAAPK